MDTRSVRRRHHRLQLLDHARLNEHASLLVRDRHVEHLREHRAPQMSQSARPVRLLGLHAPAGLRALVEAVHGEGDLVPVPAPFQAAEIKNLGKERAAAHHALSNVIDWDKGYRQSQGLPDVDYPTRIGPEQRTLMLARWQNGQLQSWASGGDTPEDATPAEREALSEVRASAARLKGIELPAQNSAEIQALTKDWPDWKRGSVAVCPVAGGGRFVRGCGTRLLRVFGSSP